MDTEFQVGDHVFLRVNPVTGVGCALKCRKLTPRFVGPFKIIEKVGVVAYQIALPPSLLNLHYVFHVSKLRKYVYDKSHVIQVDNLEVRDNLTVETWPVRIKDQEVKHLRGKEIVLVKVTWVGPTGESVTWESESRMKVSYLGLFPSGNFRGRKFFLRGRVVTTQFSLDLFLIVLINAYMCLYVLVCDYLSLGAF